MTSPTILYFVRHAHSPYVPNREVERGLSESGHQDAVHVAKILSEYAIDVVVSSPYTRAVESVQPTASKIGTSVHIEEGFRERTLSNEPVDDFENAMVQVWDDPSFSFEGGESNEVAQKRGIEAVRRTLDRWKGKSIAIGTHGNILTLILNHYDRSYSYDFWKQLSMPDIYLVKFDDYNPSKIECIYK